MRASSLGATLVALLLLPSGARALDVKGTLDKLAFPSDTVAKVQSGEFVEVPLTTTTDRDLNVGIAFLVKQDPAALARLLEDRQVRVVDPGVIARGDFHGDGSLEQLAGLTLSPTLIAAFRNAEPGEDLNLSNEEIAAVHAAGDDPTAIQQAVRALLLARYRAYRAKGLAGIASYARDGSTTSPADDLARIDRNARATQILSPSFYDLLDAYPAQRPPDLAETLAWTQFEAHGEDTLALVHRFQATFDGIPVLVQRQYYVSAGYNAEQAIAGFLPLTDGTLVVYTNHTSTDQVAGFGSSVKRSVGRKLLASQLEEMFAKARAAVP